MKLVVTGSSGRVGGSLTTFLRAAGHDVIALTRSDFDLTNLSALRQALETIDYDAWINPAAMSSPDACEQQQENASAINDVAPTLMAEICHRRGKHLLHFSTDYVFSGHQPGKRGEDETATPINHYGRSKHAGECAVLAHHPEAAIIRVSWIYGACIPAFVEQCRARLLADQPMDAIADKWSIPTAMPDLCQWVEFLLEQRAGGIFHACHSGPAVSWHGIALAVQEQLHRHGILTARREIIANSLCDVKNFIATRPIHTAMDNRRLSSLLPQPIDDWRDALARVLRDMNHSH